MSRPCARSQIQPPKRQGSGPCGPRAAAPSSPPAQKLSWSTRSSRSTKLTPWLIDAVVAGDVCYNQVHMMTAYTDDVARQAWIESLDAIAAMNPSVVVSGHKRVDAPDSPDTIEQSKQYLRDFSRVASEQDTAEGIVAEMLELHGDRDNPYTLWASAQRVVANRS